MMTFAIFAVLLVAVVGGFLLPPLWFGQQPAPAGADRRATNLAIFRDQLAELERELGEGNLTTADYEQARRELQHRLLAEVDTGTPTVPASHAPSRPAAIALIVALPLLALIGYKQLGNPDALDPQRTAPRPAVSAAQIEGMVAKLADRLQANPEDLQGWLMLARSYKALGRPEDAAAAYGKAEKLVLEDASLLADYAEALAMSKGAGFKGKPRQLIDRALKIDAHNAHALLLAGAAAMEAGNRQEAVGHWEKLLPMVEPGSEIATMLKDSIDRIKQGTGR